MIRTEFLRADGVERLPIRIKLTDQEHYQLGQALEDRRNAVLDRATGPYGSHFDMQNLPWDLGLCDELEELLKTCQEQIILDDEQASQASVALLNRETVLERAPVFDLVACNLCHQLYYRIKRTLFAEVDRRDHLGKKLRKAKKKGVVQNG